MFSKFNSINCRGELLNLENPIVMGILNITPDSFFDGGKYNSQKEWIFQTEKMLNEGAKIIDIGAVSTRPNAPEIDEKEEINRIMPVIKTLIRNFPKAIFSVDTWRANIAEMAICEGVHIINDISGGTFDKNMFKTIAKHKVPYVLMHTSGTPKTMQHNPKYNNITYDIISFFSKQINEMNSIGITDIIIDPGFGFGKTIDHNYELMANLADFQIFKQPLLVGISRKSMINKFLNISPDEALNGTTALHTIALLKGAKILRVHDVNEAIEAIKIVEKIKYFDGN